MKKGNGIFEEPNLGKTLSLVQQEDLIALYLYSLYTIFVSPYPIRDTLASSSISSFLPITGYRGTNPYPNLTG